jgi:PhoH-like ATPase
MNKSLFILDTNVLLHDPRALHNFSHGTIVLHFSVISELESFKKESSDRGYNARESIRILDDLRSLGSLTDGINLPNGGSIFIAMPKCISFEGLTNSVDDQIIGLALYLKNQENNVTLISKDFAVRIKADIFKISVSDYQNEGISKDTFYQGWKEFIYPSGDIKFKVEELLKEIQKNYQFTVNEFVLLTSSHADKIYRIFRYVDVNHFLEVRPEDSFLWNVEARNPHQEMVINLLLDDSIQFVNLCGPSGTGKTFLVLASMLYKVLCTKTYQRLLVSRPLVPLGPDIGYLPGDLYEKLQSWMQPIKDNLEFLLYQINQTGNSDTLCNINNYNGVNKNKKKQSQKKQQWNDDSNRKVTMEDLIGNHGKVSLEAITYMRGRSIPYQAIFIDEVQNLTPHEVKTLISRAGEGSKIILVGDPYQIDSPYLDFVTNGLVVSGEKFKGQSIFGSVYLQISERSVLSSLANELM